MADYIKAPLTGLYSDPQAFEDKPRQSRQSRQSGPLISELLHGEEVTVVKSGPGWALVENRADRHTGYVDAADIHPGDEPTHVVSTPGSFLYTTPDLKSSTVGRLSFLSKVAVVDVVDQYARTEHGYLHCATLTSLSEFCADPVDTARSFMDVPYKWGGRSSVGLDCSSLTQLAFAAAGIALPRNAGPQCKVLTVDKMLEEVARGDLLFVPGHVMLATGPDTLIHANAFHMRVIEEPIEDALTRFNQGQLAVKGRPSSTAEIIHALREQVTVKTRPIAVNQAAFRALSGPDIMS